MISDERERKFPVNSIGGGADMETDGGSFLLDFHWLTDWSMVNGDGLWYYGQRTFTIAA